MIRASQLVKRYGDFAAVDDIDFHVHAGEVFGFLGIGVSFAETRRHVDDTDLIGNRVTRVQAHQFAPIHRR